MECWATYANEFEVYRLRVVEILSQRKKIASNNVDKSREEL